MKYKNRKNTFFILLLSLLLFTVGCRKKDDSLSGNWFGTLTIEISHQHEEYQEWEEIIEHEGEPDEVIVHQEHITWSFFDRVAIEFQFSVNEPLYEARVNGKGSGRQEAQFAPPGQCRLSGVETPGFEVSVLGTMDSSTFDLQVVPDVFPIISIGQVCEHVRVTLPVYSAALVQVISNIRQSIPAQSGMTVGGSGTVGLGSGYAPMAYIYFLTLEQR